MVGALQLGLGAFKVQSWVKGRSEMAGFGGCAVRLKGCGRRAMIGGAHLSSRCGEGQWRLEVGHFPVMEAEIRRGANA
jgi:hypothetical protein